MSTAFEVNLDHPVYIDKRIECHPISPTGEEQMLPVRLGVS